MIGCISIESLPRDFYKLKCLQSLSCAQCSKLKSFPEIKGNMRKLRKLDLSETAITEVPSSIEHLNGVEDLDLKSICTLSSLKTLQLDWCSRLEGFPEFTKEMENLESIELSATNINELPSSIGHLMALLYLDLSSCPIVSLPESICNLSSLQALFLDNCLRLKGFPEIKVGDMKNLRTLDFRSTESICNSRSLKTLYVFDCLNLHGLQVDLGGLQCLEDLMLSHQGVIRRDNFFSSLKRLYVRDCNLMEGGIPSDIWQLALVVFSVKHNHPTIEQDSSSHRNFSHHGSAPEDPNRNAHNKRKYPTEQSLTEEPPHHKRFSGTQD
ncbi:putative WRKY transcription factor 19 [Vitis vinifera]|uniref:Putative WRKY transcription factor 19 n=1 Tax=Vitis vinifera TaxID=29760 RepID=A0A438DQP9_VITVI|nr:putative WRKY transcription factor 19 [Vitis vinifera]